MHKPRPGRLKGCSYRGCRRYFLTTCTFGRRHAFDDAAIVEGVLAQILHSARAWKFDVLAYCFMPDHIHMLVEGTTDSADLPRLVKEIKGRSGLHHRRATGRRLWQDGYYGRVLRRDEDVLGAMGYIVANPVRAGLALSFDTYPFVGSGVYTLEEIREGLQQYTGPGWRP